MWDFVAGRLDEVDRLAAGYHIAGCPACDLYRKEIRALHSGLKNLARVEPPIIVQLRLKVAASRERSRRLGRQDFRTWLRERGASLRLLKDHLLKPFAVPAAGGLLMSTLCFGLIFGALHSSVAGQSDIPIGVFSEAGIEELSPFACGQKDVMVQLSVDSEGRVTDYQPWPASHTATHDELQEIGNFVLYSSFTPALRFGRPVSSKRIFYMSHISVKG
jgi:hypothetical protein